MKIEKITEIAEEIKIKLRALGTEKYYTYPNEIAPYSIDTVIDILTGTGKSNANILEDINGCDMDWSLIGGLTFEDRKYSVHGSVSSGSLVFELKS